MKLYGAMVGTETFDYSEYTVMNFVNVYLEPLNTIITGEDFHIDDKYGVTTAEYLDLLRKGNIDIVHSLFVSQHFIDKITVPFVNIRDYRMGFVSRYFFEQTILNATAVLAKPEPILGDNARINEELLRIDLNTRILSYIALHIAKEIANNNDIPSFASMGINTRDIGSIDQRISNISNDLVRSMESTLASLKKSIIPTELFSLSFSRSKEGHISLL